MDLTDLYQDVIREHSRKPRHHHVLEDATEQAEGHNPLCGDHLTVFIKLEGDTITEAAFTSQACALCTASASMLTRLVEGQTLTQALAAADAFAEAMTTAEEPDFETPDLEDLAALSGVRKYPMRVKCVTLPWHTLKAALNEQSESEPTTTE